MYEYIRGKLITKGDDIIVIEAGGIGYRIFTSIGTLASSGNCGDEVKIFTHLHVREDVMDLYGFRTKDEVNMFKMLLSVSGVGPKASLSLVSCVGPSAFGLAVITEDFNELTKAQGIGKKGAQKIIIELKDKLKKQQEKAGITSFEMKTESRENDPRAEAVDVLQVLGYSAFEATKAVKSVGDEMLPVEKIIKKALAYIADNMLR